MKQIRIMEAFVFAFESLKKYPMLLLAPPIFFSLIGNGLRIFSNVTSKIPVFTAMAVETNPLEKFGFLFTKSPISTSLIAIFVFSFIVILAIVITISISLEIGRIRIAFHVFEKSDEEATWSLYNNFGKGIIGKYFWASLLLVLIILGGLILFLVPGFILALMYQFVLFILVEKKVSISNAFQQSNKLTNGIKWQLFGFGLLVFFLELMILIPMSLLQKAGLNFIYFPLNIIVTPIVGVFFFMASIFIYKDIGSQQEEIDLQIEGYPGSVDQESEDIKSF